MRTALHFAATALVLAVCNWMIFSKQRVVEHGTTVLLALVPVDPRSLIQGDYMDLRYAVAAEVPENAPQQGAIVIRHDEREVGSLVRVHRDEPLGAGETLLKYRRGNRVRLGAESFLFEEGAAAQLAGAKFGEIKVAPDGSSVLIGLRDAKLNRLGVTPPAKSK